MFFMKLGKFLEVRPDLEDLGHSGPDDDALVACSAMDPPQMAPTSLLSEELQRTCRHVVFSSFR
jgi:hypothetical protein